MENNYKVLFDELTQEDNFKKLMDLRSFYDDVIKPSLIGHFWDEVYDAINENLKSMNGWKCMINKYSTIYLYKESWIVDVNQEDDPTAFAIVWKQLEGKPFFGIQIDTRIKSKFELYRNLNELPKLEGWNLLKKDSNFVVWSYYSNSLDFQAQKTLVDFLPSNRKNKVEEFARILINLGNSAESYIDNLSQKSEFKFNI